MNNIEVLKTLYKKSCKMVGGRLKGGFINHEELINKSIDAAISALEKQIPKKRYIKFPYSYCPVCNENITDESPNYCPECGQAIDWRSEDE